MPYSSGPGGSYPTPTWSELYNGWELEIPTPTWSELYNGWELEIPTPKPYIFIIRVNRQIKCPNNLFFVLWNLMISWIVFILHRKIFPIHHTYIYSLVSYLFIKQDQMILTCNSAVASLMLSWFFYRMLQPWPRSSWREIQMRLTSHWWLWPR
jgi:hypothetical protein